MKNLIVLIAAISLAGCATGNPDYVSKNPDKGNARITVYWPRQWQSQWGRYIVSFNDVPYRVLKNEGYIEAIRPEGKVTIKTQHFQEDKVFVTMEIQAKKNRNHYFKIDTQPKPFTLLSAVGDVLSIGTVVAGVKAQQHMSQTGTATWSDVYNVAQYKAYEEEQKANNRTADHHVLIPVEETVAIKELIACCNSKDTKDVDPPRATPKSSSE